MFLVSIIAGVLSSAACGDGRLSSFICAASQLLVKAASALAEFHGMNAGLLRFCHLFIFVGSSSDPKPSTPSSDSTDSSPKCCRTCHQFEDRQDSYHGAFLTAGDVAKVVNQLGLGWDNDDEEMQDHEADEDGSAFMCRDCRVRGAALALLEQKEAGEQELREAFAVFDANRDGYITPTELWMVMRRLDFREGMLIEECRRMVEAFDQDGDGRISFAEFRSLLVMAC